MSEEGQSPADNWRDSLPESLRDAPYIGKAATPEEAAQAIQAAAQYQGNSIRILDESATPEQWQEFTDKLSSRVPGLVRLPGDTNDLEAAGDVLGKLGRPEKAEAYSAVEGIGDEQLAALKESAHRAGLTDAQFKRLAAGMADEQAQARSAQAESLAQLKNQHGDKWDTTVEVIDKVAGQLGFPPELVGAIKDGSMGSNWVEAFANMANAFGGEGAEGFMQGQQPPADAPMTPDEAQMKIEETLGKMHTQGTSKAEQRVLQRELLKLQYAADPSLAEGPDGLPLEKALETLGRVNY